MAIKTILETAKSAFYGSFPKTLYLLKQTQLVRYCKNSASEHDMGEKYTKNEKPENLKKGKKEKILKKIQEH